MTVSLNGTVAADRTPWPGLFPMNAAAARLVLDFLETGPDARSETAYLKAALDRLSRISGDGYADVYRSIDRPER